MTSSTRADLSLVEPAYFTAPTYTKTLGPEVAGIAELASFAPDPEQRLALDAIFAMKPGNKVAALEAAVIAPRQNIKTGLFKQCALGWLFVTDQRLIIWSAHEFSTSQEAHRDLTELLEGSDALRKRVKAIHRGNGDEGIELLTGQRVKFKARTKTGGRGLSGDKIVLDEAFALQPSHMGSLFPLLSVRPDPQVVYGSSAGLVDSAVLRGIRDRGRIGDPGLVYLEWADDLPGDCQTDRCDHSLAMIGCRLDDPARWRRANSQIDRRMTADYVAAERRAMPPAEFARERLGWWDEDAATGVFDMTLWQDLRDPESSPSGALSFGLEVSDDRSWSVIGMAGGRSDGAVHVDVVSNDRGTGNVVATAKRLQARHPQMSIHLDPSSQAGSLANPLDDAGIPVVRMSSQEVAQACGVLTDLVQARDLRHLGQPALDVAVSGAKRKTSGDAYKWDRRKPAVDISPLAAVTLAAWAHLNQPPADVLNTIW